MRVRVQDLRSHGQPVGSGILTLGTNFNFRSQSCRLYWLVQISKEMYEFSLGGQLHYEMFVNSFLRKLLDKWCAKQVRHTLTVVFFSRTFYLHELDPTKVCVVCEAFLLNGAQLHSRNIDFLCIFL